MGCEEAACGWWWTGRHCRLCAVSSVCSAAGSREDSRAEGASRVCAGLLVNKCCCYRRSIAAIIAQRGLLWLVILRCDERGSVRLPRRVLGKICRGRPWRCYPDCGSETLPRIRTFSRPARRNRPVTYRALLGTATKTAPRFSPLTGMITVSQRQLRVRSMEWVKQV